MMRRLAAILLITLLCGPAFAQSALPTDNDSVTIATGNTFQTILSARSPRSLTIENNNAGDNCWITVDGGSPTKAKAIMLLPGGSYTRYYPYVPNAAIQGTCATTGDSIYVDTQ